jgi:pimeloyl-ACP methyl ester carboxylesterase
MNGWQRIGIAAFVMWALVASAVSWFDFNRSQGKFYQAMLSGCRSSYDAAPKDEGTTAYERCFQEAADRFQAEWQGAIEGFWQDVLFAITIPALIVWGLISLVIVTVRWIRKRFA